MNEQLVSLHRYLDMLGPAVLPGGADVLRLLDWDNFTNYYEIDSRLNYVNKVGVSFVGNHVSDIKFKQTIMLYGHGLHKKHEAVFAVSMANVEKTELVEFSGKHPGRGAVPVPGMYMGYEPASVECHGKPHSVRFHFKAPVVVRRWSCMPITAGVVEQEVFVYRITLWFPSRDAACRAKETFENMRAEAEKQPPGPSVTLAPPQFDEVPSVPMGGIRRF